MIVQREQRIQTVCLLILATVAVAGVLYWLRPVLIPFVLALLFTLGLSPLVDVQMNRLRFPRILAVVGAFGIGFLILTLLGALVSVSVGNLIANAGVYQQQISVLVNNTLDSLPLTRFGIDRGAVLQQIPVGTIGGMIVGTGNALVDIVSRGALVLVFMLFLMISREARVQPVGGLLGEVEVRIKRYVVFKALISAATGIMVGVVLSVLGVQLAMVFGLAAFLLNFIPSVGSIVATLLPLPVVLVTPEISNTAAILAISVPGSIQLVMGNVVEPKVIGDSLDLHPVVILMALVVWGMLWGVVGMLLATPMTAVAKILLARMEHTAPIANLLAGRVDALTSD